MRNQSCPGARLRYGDRKRIRAIVLLADYEPGSSNMTDNEDAEPQSSTTPYLCNLISALSVGCIGVAFGTFVDSQWRTLILETGIIGAFAALGLSKAERYRRATVTERKRQANKAAAELRLNSAVVALVPIDQSSNAVGNILFDRTMADRPVLAITTLDPHNKGQTISAHLKDVSTWCLGLFIRMNCRGDRQLSPSSLMTSRFPSKSISAGRGHFQRSCSKAVATSPVPG